MAGLFSVADICERALRKIGAFSINDSAADGEELQEAAFWLDMILAEQAETEACFWLRPSTITKALTADTPSYVLSELMGTNYPQDGLVNVVNAWLTDGSNDQPLGRLRRKEYENLSQKDASGRPSAIYIDRLSAPTEQTIYITPVPATTGLSLNLLVQSSTPEVSNLKDVKSHGLRAGWQRALVRELAAEIGDGPVRRLDSGKIDRWRRDAEMALKGLQKYNSSNTERVGPRRVKPWGR